MARRKVVVLLAEDSLADQRLVQRAMARGQYEVVLKTVDNGKDVLNYLKREGVFGHDEGGFRLQRRAFRKPEHPLIPRARLLVPQFIVR